MSTVSIPPAPVPPAPVPPAATPPPTRPRRRGLPLWAKILVALVGLGFVFVLLQINEGARGLLGLSIAGILFAMTMRTPSVGLAAAFVYLCVMGEVRRLLIPLYGWSGIDPLLLVSGLTVVLVLGATRRSPERSPLSRKIVWLAGIMVLEVVNPLQGGLPVGLAGLLFYLVPLLWYFAAERLASPAIIHKMLQAIVAVAVAGGLYGAWQTAFGFNTAEQMWMQAVKGSYAALAVTSTQNRAFSFFTSAQEYTQFLGLGLVIVWVQFLRGRRAGMLLAPFLAVMLFLATSRGPVIGVLITMTILWAVQGRTRAAWGPRGLVAALVTVVGLVLSLTHLQGVKFGDSTQALVSHQVGGLLNPFDSKQSTAGAHGAIALNGLLSALKNPLGYGLGFTTIATQKFGGEGGSTELDFSNMFVSLGLLGGFLYLFIVGTILRRALLFWHHTRSTQALAILGVLLFTLGSWLNGGNYASAMLTWACIGVLDRLWPALPVRPRPRGPVRLSSAMPGSAL